MEKTRHATSLVKNAFYKGLLNAFNLIIPIFTIPYLYRVLSPTSMGDFEYANTLFSYFNLIGTLGIYTYGIREISRVRDNKDQVNKTYSALFSVGLISNLIVYCAFVSLILFGFSDSPLFRLLFIFSLNLVANIFYTEWINEAFEDFRFITIKTAIIRLLYVSGIFILIKSPDDIWKYAALTVSSNFLNYISSFIYSKKYTFFKLTSVKISCDIFKVHLPALIFILILDNSVMLYTALDRLMLGAYSESQMVAYYSVGQRVMEIVRSLLMTITYVSLPRLSYCLGKDMALYKSGIQNLIKIGLLLAIPMAIGLGILSKNIVFLFAGEQYAAAALPLIIFSIRIITMLIENITANQILFLHQKEKTVAAINILWGIGNLCANYALLHFNIFSPATAILSTLCIEIGVLCTEFYYIKTRLHMHITLFTKEIFKYLLFASCFLPIIYLLKLMIHNNISVLIASTICCFIFYAACLAWSKDETFYTIYKKLTKRQS